MSDEQQPYVPAGSTMAELTVKAVVLGVVLAAIMGAANAYLALKAGQTVSATFPAAILALAAFRLPFFRGTILEQNVARAAGTVGEALAAGAIFTIPAFLLVTVNGERLWTEFDYWQTSLILLIGGILGVLFITLLRRTLAVEAALPFPESKACAAIVRAGQAGATGAKYVFGAMGLGMLIQIFKDGAGLRLFRESVEVFRQLPSSVIHHFDSSRVPLGDVQHRGAVAFATPSISPALIGVGYIIGFELSAINFSGGVLAWLVFIPLAFFLDPNLAANLSAGGVAPAEGELIFSVWYNIVRPVAVGAMLVGAANTMWGMRSSIGQAFAGAFKRSHAGTEKSRLDRDLDSRGILLGIVGLTIPMTWIYWNFTHNLVGAIVAAVVMLVLGFLLSAVGGYLVGLVGGSNQPVSGLTLSALILAALLMVAFGVTGLQGVGAVLGVSAVVCCAICVSGSLIQDLKVGHLLGGTPKKMEIAEIIATITTAFVLVFPMLWLHQANIKQGGIGIGDRELSAPQAGLMAQLAQGIVGGEMPWGLILFGMCFSLALILMKAPSPTLIAVGMYLPFETTGAIFVGGCIKWLADKLAARRGIAGESFDSFGSLVASGLIAGESLTGVMMAGIVLLSESFKSITYSLFGVEQFAWVAGPAGAWASLVALAAIIWVLVKIPLDNAKPSAA
ncbi:MAG: oligopeptide transporter, OPT family [Thermoanaerobaculia bacterium]|jgi:putative OPT family oligopeptide transporter|nr:oligopeptide transporter, OPT family [Thermoanaerobaculia bacterium]MBP9825702.1 oligopeptide transporter, OPT family [Thermoanaerobaculia bacterium]